mmetsp:Transcript_27479/g.64423  ORF Transcript_27479/g.64423 Transcript_27479/m.64423 type:complete len:407 (+) Transcript_27479:156-1376(+)
MGAEKTKRCGFCYCMATISVIVFTGVAAWYFAVFAKDVEESIANCGGCHCIPDESTSFQCPSNQAPPTTYPEGTHLNAWKSQTILNAYVLNCNPFEDGVDCDTDPPLDPNYEWVKLGETAVCAVHHEAAPEQRSRNLQQQQDAGGFGFGVGDNNEHNNGNNDGGFDFGDNNGDNNGGFDSFEDNGSCDDKAYYRIKTYPSRAAAENAGGFVTHVGNCGVCSTLQDLAVYASLDAVGVTSPGNFCRRQATSSLENGLSCYLGLGMTQDCAKIWADTSWNTASNCFSSCVLNPTLPTFRGDFSDATDFNSTDASPTDKWYNLPVALKDWFNSDETESEKSAIPSNGPAPECALSTCITCNDDVSAPIFERFAGRSRRRSGLLSTAARPCGSIPKINQVACPATRPLVD